MPRDQRPFTRDGVIDALLQYGYHDFEAVGRFSRGLEFQVLMEKEVDADHMSSRGILEVKNARGIICGCVVRKFMQREFRIRVDWLPAVTTEDEVGELFAKYGHILKVYKEMAPQVRGHPRYWGGGHLYSVHYTKFRGGDSCDSGLPRCGSPGSQVQYAVCGTGASAPVPQMQGQRSFGLPVCGLPLLW